MNPAWPTKGDVEITYLIHSIPSCDPQLFTHSAYSGSEVLGHILLDR